MKALNNYTDFVKRILFQVNEFKESRLSLVQFNRQIQLIANDFVMISYNSDNQHVNDYYSNILPHLPNGYCNQIHDIFQNRFKTSY